MTKTHTINMFQIPPLMVFEYGGDMDKILEYVSNVEYRDSTGNIKSENDYILDDDNLIGVAAVKLSHIFQKLKL